MHKWRRKACLVTALCAATAAGSRAQTLNTLYSFCSQANCTDGAYPVDALVQATNGNLYGTTEARGKNNGGTVFEITPGGTLTTLYEFCSDTQCADGGDPTGALVQASDGNLYGTTMAGGTHGHGTVFKITLTGTLTTLHSFHGYADGAYPAGGLVQATDGRLYGTTSEGGNNGNCSYGCGTVFGIELNGALTTLHNFDYSDGGSPSGSLIQGTDGKLYGMTSGGGNYVSSCVGGCGTVFSMTSGGALTTLHLFDSTDGSHPQGGLVQATNGNFYGTTVQGGSDNGCMYGCGTAFELTPSGTLTTLHNFTLGDDSVNPEAGLIQATDGNLYGTACCGGSGIVFEITPAGTFETVLNFYGTGDAEPMAGLTQDTNGEFYGTTVDGGENFEGTVFSLSTGFGPFVETLPTSGAIGAEVKILGNHLTGVTSVTFNGTPATFKVVSSSEISTKVPAGATTGTVQVTLPSQTVSSNVPFRVIP